MTNYRSVRPG